MSTGSHMIRVTARQDKRRRAGQVFTKQPVELGKAELGEGKAGFLAFHAIASDPQLDCVLIDPDGSEQTVTDEMVAEMDEFVAERAEDDEDFASALIERLLSEAEAEPEPEPTPAPAQAPTPAPTPEPAAKDEPAKVDEAKAAPTPAPEPKTSKPAKKAPAKTQAPAKKSPAPKTEDSGD